MARSIIPQQFQSIAQLKASYAIILPKPYEWRLIAEPCVGQINGLPKTQGIVVATNGIECLIVQENGLVLGHNDFFVADDAPSTDGAKLLTRVPTKRSSRVATPCLDEFI